MTVDFLIDPFNFFQSDEIVAAPVSIGNLGLANICADAESTFHAASHDGDALFIEVFVSTRHERRPKTCLTA
ncbi:hypothetical protein QZM46_10630 [Burkholderia vietnamiensis]|uniref:Uncharacterized protein n=1 Tax=Burkholderia vietnamiensis TaxID=60552 RepID=A0ABS1AQK6_BURVI|nr:MULTISPECIES: hypothetical protein [Burkholderia]KVE64692.1 hypothetical protein WI96_12345 [Burkholderia vietnamiensis]KVF13754.1 hypothetical protein WJ05_10140 [Burkholderia vietnamiensis]KVF25897.1 hypothetical protein WJ08_29350 [Burkholderia vietnamiensis]KVF45886.1 hypothetical protein WJ10_05265 [Burkholderia vietnamiensis]KVF64983.1 hypothetical protein WJ17_22480 [Burkholderia vietnamiensis]